MTDTISPHVKEGWNGPGRKDGVITPITPEDDALHIDVGKKNQFEWWYFDAHLNGGYTLVAFFYAANPNPGLDVGKIGVELVLLRPDGRKTQHFVKYKKSDFYASREKADVKIGQNYLEVEYSQDDLPTYRIHLDEGELGFDLVYHCEVVGWKPGSGFSHFADLGYFAWVIPFAKASVSGTVRDDDTIIEVSGVGYHDHNWLNFSFSSIIEYWMWGRIYSKTFTISYAFIQCNEKVDHHVVKVLMAAKGKDVILSTGEYDFSQEDFEYSSSAGHSFPRTIMINAPNVLTARLDVHRVLEAEDMLSAFSAPLRIIAKYILRIKPGYFRLDSNFKLTVDIGGKSDKEDGNTLHEIVTFKQLGNKS